jgi:hypothetical protein
MDEGLAVLFALMIWCHEKGPSLNVEREQLVSILQSSVAGPLASAVCTCFLEFIVHLDLPELIERLGPLLSSTPS